MSDELTAGGPAFHSQPAYLAALAVLCGLPAPPVENARVLELQSTTFETVTGEFDFIFVPKGYSQLDPAGRSALLNAIRDHLAPHGLGIVGHDANPRSNLRGALQLFGGAAVRQLVDGLPESDGANALKTELQTLENEPAPAGNPSPLPFVDFANALAGCGLQYVAESQYSSSSFAQLGSDRRALDPAGDDLVRREQYLDFRIGRRFRRSLVCHAGRTVPHKPNPVETAQLWLVPRVELRDPITDVDATEYDDAIWDGGPAVQIHDPLYRHVLRRLQAEPSRRLQLSMLRPDVNEMVGFDVGDDKSMELLMQVAHKGTIEEVWYPLAGG